MCLKISISQNSQHCNVPREADDERMDLGAAYSHTNPQSTYCKVKAKPLETRVFRWFVGSCLLVDTLEEHCCSKLGSETVCGRWPKTAVIISWIFYIVQGLWSKHSIWSKHTTCAMVCNTVWMEEIHRISSMVHPIIFMHWISYVCVYIYIINYKL